MSTSKSNSTQTQTSTTEQLDNKINVEDAQQAYALGGSDNTFTYTNELSEEVVEIAQGIYDIASNLIDVTKDSVKNSQMAYTSSLETISQKILGEATAGFTQYLPPILLTTGVIAVSYFYFNKRK